MGNKLNTCKLNKENLPNAFKIYDCITFLDITGTLRNRRLRGTLLAITKLKTVCVYLKKAKHLP